MQPESSSLSLDRLVADVVSSVHCALAETVGSTLVGAYVVGSLATGSFDADVSDIDLIAILTSDPSDELGIALAGMHDELARRHPRWAGRLEVVYVSANRLETYDQGIPRIAVISPGEPFHIVEGGRDWVLTWYPAREEAFALVGPPISTLIPEIPRTEFLAAVREHVRGFGERIGADDTRGAQAYVILTICRGLYTLRLGARPSKVVAAAWAVHQFPQWAELIESALVWRKEQVASPAAGRADIERTRRFVAEMSERVV